MNYVDFYGHKVSKLIVGDNPFNGHSYIPDYVNGQEMTDYCTEEKILEAMFRMEELGINTMLPLADPYIIRILQHYRSNGGKMNFIFQPYAPMNLDASIMQMLSVNPIGVYVHADYPLEIDKPESILERLEKYREKMSKEYGVKVGLSTHKPWVVQLAEKEGWDFDFYFACMYNFRRNRDKEKSGFITGKPKDGIEVRYEDRGEMLDVLKDIKKPVIAFKIFAGGQLITAIDQEEKRRRIKDAYNTIFTALKPNDFATIGIFQKYSDQLGENVELYNEWYNETNK